MADIDQTKFHTYMRIRWTNKNTLRYYGLMAKRLEKFWVGGELTQDSINSFLADISQNKSYGNPIYRAFLHAYLDCYQDDLDDLHRRIRIIKHTSRKARNVTPKYLEIKDLNRLIRDMPDPQLKVMLRLLFETGLRRMELLAVSSSDIDFGDRTITGVGKGNKEFRVKFSPTSREWLMKWMDMCRDTDHPFWFVRERGSAMDFVKDQDWTFDYRLARAARTIGFPHITPHQLRHSLGYHLRRNLKLDLVQIKEKLRHDSVVTTTIYAPASQDEVDQAIDEKLFKIKPDPQPDPDPKPAPDQPDRSSNRPPPP